MAGQGGFKTFINGETNFPLTSSAEVAEVTSISLPELGMTDIDVNSGHRVKKENSQESS